MTKVELETSLDRGLLLLRREFEGVVETERLVETGHDRFESLYRQATITEFIPLLVYRQIRDELRDCGHDGLHAAA